MRQPGAPQPAEAGENPAFLQEQLITYIGNKRSLLPFIGEAVGKVRRRLGRDKLRFLDLFSGTGVVARYLKQHSELLIANDLEAYSRITNECYLSNRSELDHGLLADTLEWLADEIGRTRTGGFIRELYAPEDESAITKRDRVFYTRRNAAYLDSARMAIARLPEDVQVYFLAPLLAKASVHANTSGVFKGFYKNKEGVGQFGGAGRDALGRILGEIHVELPVFSNHECEFLVCQEDANALVRKLPELDLAYFDPPYNQHPYGSNYFMLNLLAAYQPPGETSRVSGIPADWNRSRYNLRGEAAEALFEAVSGCPAKFILISYNSEGFIPPGEFTRRLGALGKVDVCETSYNTFRGSRNLRGRSIHVTEFLYLLEKHGP